MNIPKEWLGRTISIRWNDDDAQYLVTCPSLGAKKEESFKRKGGVKERQVQQQPVRAMGLKPDED